MTTFCNAILIFFSFLTLLLDMNRGHGLSQKAISNEEYGQYQRVQPASIERRLFLKVSKDYQTSKKTCFVKM